MTVSQLIGVLQDMPQDLQVYRSEEKGMAEVKAARLHYVNRPPLDPLGELQVATDADAPVVLIG